MTRPIPPAVLAENVARLDEEWAAARGGNRELSPAQLDALARATLPAALSALRGERAQTSNGTGP